MLAKGVIVASDDSTAIRAPLDSRLAPPLVPVANQPILFHALETMREAGVADVAIVACDATADDIRAAVGDGGRFGLRLTHLITEPSTAIDPSTAMMARNGRDASNERWVNMRWYPSVTPKHVTT